MNIEEYDLDSLRKIVRDLQKENNLLKSQLETAGIPFKAENVFEEKISDNPEYDLDQGSRINLCFIDDTLANRFFSMFWGRTYVFQEDLRKKLSMNV